MARRTIVYVLKSLSNPARHYTGITANVDNRLACHNAGLCPHSAKHRPWRLNVTIRFADEASALRFEKYLKSGSGRAFAKRHFDQTPAPSDVRAAAQSPCSTNLVRR